MTVGYHSICQHVLQTHFLRQYLSKHKKLKSVVKLLCYIV